MGCKRVVSDPIEDDGVYGSRLAAGGPYVFLATPTVNDAGRMAEPAKVTPPYHLSPSAHVRSQTHDIFKRYTDDLGRVGSSVNDIVQVEHYIQHKFHPDGYLEISRGPGCIERGRPGSALIVTLSPMRRTEETRNGS